MASRQFEHLQESSLQRLREMIPPDCPLLVQRGPAGGFLVQTVDAHNKVHNRYQVVAAYISGFVTCWRRMASARADRYAVRDPVDG